MALFYSFTDYTIIESLNWIGFKEFHAYLSDEFFFISLKNTIVYTLLYVPLDLVVSLAAAHVAESQNEDHQIFSEHFFICQSYVHRWLQQPIGYWLLKSTVWFASNQFCLV